MQRVFLLAVLLLAAFTSHATDGSVYQRSGFIPNAGQWPSHVKYRIGIPGGAMFLRDNGLSYILYDAEAVKQKHEQSHHAPSTPVSNTIRHHAVHMQLMGAVNSVIPSQEEGSFTRYNYYKGNDRSKWASNLQAWKKITYPSIYPQTDWVIHTGENGIKYDFIVHPGGNSDNVKMRFNGADGVEIINNTLYIHTSLGDIVEQIPVAWQEENGVKSMVDCAFRQLPDGSIGFDLGAYDHSKTLILDPQLVFASYSGSLDDNWGYTATYDNAGNGYSGGIVFGANFSTTAGAYGEDFGGGQLDIGILKYTPDGSNALYVTYVGGGDIEYPHSMIVNEYDELIVFGTTGSADFPVTSGAYSTTFKGGPASSFESGYIQMVNGLDIFVIRLSTDGSEMLASTFIGGTGNDGFNSAIPFNYADEIRGAVWVDKDNNIYVGTSTQSTDFPMSANAVQPTFGGGLQDGVIAKLNGNLSQLIWSTYLGGSADDGIYYLVVDEGNRTVVTGGTISDNFPVALGAYHSGFGGTLDGFVSVIDSSGTSLAASTYIGYNGTDQSFICGSDKSSNIYIFGQTESTGDVYNINTAIGVSGGNQFLMKLDPQLHEVIWSNAFGNATGSPDISPTALLVDVCDKIYSTGWGGVINPVGIGTNGLVTTPDAYQSTTDNNDFYLYVMDNQAQSLIYASFLGGPTSFDHVDGGTSRFDRKGVIYQSICGGCGGLSDFPGTTPNSFSPTNNSSNCNNLLVKFDFETPITVSAFASVTQPIGCAPYPVSFSNTSVNADQFSWRIDNSEVSLDSNFTYIFSEAGTYEITLIATSSLTCNAADTVSLTVTVIADIQSAVSPITACKGQQVELGPETLDDPYYHFAWTPADGLSDPFGRQPIVTADTSMDYTVVVSVGACIDTLVQHLEVHQMLRDTLTAFEGCINETKTIGPNDTYSSTTTYNWSPATGLSSATVQNPTADFIEDSFYTLLVNYPEGCSDTLISPISIVTTPTALFSSTTFPGCDGVAYLLQDSSDNAQNVNWIFSNGQTSDDPSVVTVFPYQDTLQIVIIAQNGNCFDTLSYSQYLTDMKDYFEDNQSNAFSPNGDGINDCFSPALQLLPAPYDQAFVPCSELYVFTRWGELIYTTEGDNNPCWNGTTTGGEELPDGVYFYRFLFDGDERAGVVHLKRQ